MNYPTNLSLQISRQIPYMRIRVDVRLQLCGNDQLACIELQLLADRSTGATYVHTGCCNIVRHGLITRESRSTENALHNAAPESRTKVTPASNRSTI